MRSDLTSYHDSVATRMLQRATLTDSGCLVWTGKRNATGYGMMKFGGKSRLAHRVAFEMVIGNIPTGLTIDHLCRVRACVNPFHMEPVTQRENTLRGEGPAAKNARRTQCIRGHLLSGANLRMARHKRVCLTCKRLHHGSVGIAPGLRTVCPQGHSYSAENTLVIGGRRHCRACARARSRTYRSQWRPEVQT